MKAKIIIKKKIIGLSFSLLVIGYSGYSQVLDYANLECLYHYEMVGDRLQPKKKTTDEVILLIGSKCSSYYSYMNYVADSLRKANPEEYAPRFTDASGILVNRENLADFSTKGGLNVNPPRTTLPVNMFNGERYIINKASGELLCMVINDGKYICYTETLDKPVWEMSNDTCTVAGYRCQKATTRYGGRDWTAWFSPEIAVAEGPWKLRGLPGLILKAETGDREFTLTCTLLKRSTGRPIVKDNERQYRNVSKEELFKMKKASGNVLSRPYDYNFIEILEK